MHIRQAGNKASQLCARGRPKKLLIKKVVEKEKRERGSLRLGSSRRGLSFALVIFRVDKIIQEMKRFILSVG
jgi:hypothetical protein